MPIMSTLFFHIPYLPYDLLKLLPHTWHDVHLLPAGRQTSRLRYLLAPPRLLCRHAAARPGGEGGNKDVGRLVHDQLLADIEQARDRCKPDIILRKLQQELPASVVRTMAYGL